MMHGGGQEKGLRSGTLPTMLIASLGTACAEAKDNLSDENGVRKLRDYISSELLSMDGARRNGTMEYSLPGVLNISFDGVGGEELVNLCSLRGVCISTGSACHAGEGVASEVLLAMGFDKSRAAEAVRISIGMTTSGEDAHEIVRTLRESVKLIRG
jgi:cysteine desulfurase